MKVQVQRSTINGVETTATVPWTDQEVPSYVVLSGSVRDAARSLGFRVLGRDEVSSDVVAELHVCAMSGSFWAVQS
jgi:hypothetical protein